MNKQIDNLLQKEVSRREFLGLIGVGLISVLGITSLIKNLTGAFGSKLSENTSSTLTYGTSAYGGSKPTSSLVR